MGFLLDWCEKRVGVFGLYAGRTSSSVIARLHIQHFEFIYLEKINSSISFCFSFLVECYSTCFIKNVIISIPSPGERQRKRERGGGDKERKRRWESDNDVKSRRVLALKAKTKTSKAWRAKKGKNWSHQPMKIYTISREIERKKKKKRRTWLYGWIKNVSNRAVARLFFGLFKSCIGNDNDNRKKTASIDVTL